MNEIYLLSHGEGMVYENGRLEVTRVPGGWLYTRKRKFLFWSYVVAQTFIPLDDEFIETEPKKMGFK